MSTGDLRANRQSGFTYVGVLLGVALIGVVLSVTATVWSKEAERQRKAEADWVLAQYQRALKSYYNSAPGSVRSLPASMEHLLLDGRHLGVVRHLRKGYKVHCGAGQNADVRYQPNANSAVLAITCPTGGRPLASVEVMLDFPI